MTEYLIICLSPLDKKREAKVIKQTNFQDAIKMADNKRKKGFDAFIIRKDVVKNDYTNELEECFVVENYGYYKVYNIVNKIIFTFVVSLVLGFLYLYYKYLNRH